MFLAFFLERLKLEDGTGRLSETSVTIDIRFVTVQKTEDLI
jgi:hypothetical protein